MMVLLATALAGVIPIHGVVLGNLPDRTAVVRTEAVERMLPAQTRRYRFAPVTRFRAGTTIDAFLRANDPATLRDPIAAAAFAPGMPEPARVVPVEIGRPIPAAVLVDQNGRIVQLARSYRGKTLLLSFVFTRCPDRLLCPAISGKFAYLQQRLDPRRFALVEITLDPQYDSPAVLHGYAAAYAALPDRWDLLTGTGSTIQRLLDEFGISSMRVATANFLHDDRLFIATPEGKVADIVETAAWDPASVIAQARAVSGLASNPFERLRLALIANAIALCGGSQFAGIALLELSLFTFLTVVSLAAIWAVARVLWPKRTA
jgi:cytochrome oxidase Cu insertion factor (SCO1/SenC/PrrC family)